MPIGNLSSQIFANIYLDQLDQFIKHKLRVKYYFRYADDFIIVSSCREDLTLILGSIRVLKQSLPRHGNTYKIRLKLKHEQTNYLL